MKSWKEEIGDDAEKFAERAKSDSQCPTAEDGGNLGFVVRAKLSQQFDDIAFAEEPGKVVRARPGSAALGLGLGLGLGRPSHAATADCCAARGSTDRSPRRPVCT